MVYIKIRVIGEMHVQIDNDFFVFNLMALSLRYLYLNLIDNIRVAVRWLWRFGGEIRYKISKPTKSFRLCIELTYKRLPPYNARYYLTC